MKGTGSRQVLESGLAGLGLELSDRQLDTLMSFLDLLAKWNRTYPLTAVTDPREMVSRHLLDSLSVVQALWGSRIVDVGSGAGLPGIPLAVACPRREFLLLDSNGKKTGFITHAAGRLGLENVRVVKSRAEDYAGDGGFDTVLSRAFASLSDFAAVAGHLCAPRGRLLAMKGRLDPAELAGLDARWRIVEKRQLAVPGVAGQRHLIVLERAPGSEDR